MPTSAEISLTEPNRIVVNTPFVMKEHVKAVPGAKWNNFAREWTVPLSWTACLALKDEYPDLELGENLMEWAQRMGRTKRWLRSSRMNTELNPEDVSVNALIADPEFDWLYPHQKVDALSIYVNGGSYLLLNDVGTGKTPAALAGLRLLDRANEKHGSTSPFPVLIVAPKSMLRTWEREIYKFPAWAGRTVSIVDGTPTKVKKALEPGFDFYIIGWELLRRYSRIAAYGSTPIPAGANVDKELNALGISTMIADECHRATDPTSQRSRAFKYLMHRANYRISLTGTLVQEGAVDPWHILHCTFPHEYAGKTVYIERYLLESWGEWGERIINGFNPAREEEWRKNFEANTRRMTRAIIPNLPDVVESTRWVTLPPKHRKAYDSMKKSLVAEIEGGTLTAANQLVKASRLVQLANSYGEVVIEQDKDGNDVDRFLMTDESPKLDALMEDIANGDYEGHQVVIYSDSKQLLTFLEARLEKAGASFTKITGDVTGEDRQHAMDEFQAGEKQFCLLTDAGGEGITLTAADVMIRLIRSWSFRKDHQVAARILRIGSEIHDVVTYVDYLVEDTIDEEKVVRLNTKGEAAEEVLHDNELLLMLRSRAERIEAERLEQEAANVEA